MDAAAFAALAASARAALGRLPAKRREEARKVLAELERKVTAMMGMRERAEKRMGLFHAGDFSGDVESEGILRRKIG